MDLLPSHNAWLDEVCAHCRKVMVCGRSTARVRVRAEDDGSGGGESGASPINEWLFNYHWYRLCHQARKLLWLCARFLRTVDGQADFTSIDTGMAHDIALLNLQNVADVGRHPV